MVVSKQMEHTVRHEQHKLVAHGTAGRPCLDGRPVGGHHHVAEQFNAGSRPVRGVLRECKDIGRASDVSVLAVETTQHVVACYENAQFGSRYPVVGKHTSGELLETVQIETAPFEGSANDYLIIDVPAFSSSMLPPT